MQIEMLYSKIHRATVTDANLNYVGSITIDEDLLDASKIRVGQKVEILDINNGERFSTYAIKGVRGSKDMCLNGAAARKVHIGDKIIVVAYATYDEKELNGYEPLVVHVDDGNNVLEIVHAI
jgi:aspartate 1-decarboxylase